VDAAPASLIGSTNTTTRAVRLIDHVQTFPPQPPTTTGGPHQLRSHPEPPARPETPTPVTDTPDNTLADRIRHGHLDRELPTLIEAINHRARTLGDLRTSSALARLSVGTRVRVNGPVRPRYLQGQSGEVHDIDVNHVVVCLDNPIGRFTSGHISCSPTILERIHDPAT
jgi:hypothetical protein